MKHKTIVLLNFLAGFLNQATAMENNPPHAPSKNQSSTETGKHELTQHAPEYVTSFINLFEKNDIAPHDFDHKISQALNGAVFNAVYPPMKELMALAHFINIERPNLKEPIFTLFEELERHQPNQMYDNNRKLFFIINHLLENPQATIFSRQYLESFIQISTWFNSNYTTYVYVLLDSGNDQDTQMVLHYLDKIMQDQSQTYSLLAIVQQLTFVKNRHKISGFMEELFKRLPEYMKNNAWVASQIIDILLNSPYSHEAKTFIATQFKDTDNRKYQYELFSCIANSTHIDTQDKNFQVMRDELYEQAGNPANDIALRWKIIYLLRSRPLGLEHSQIEYLSGMESLNNLERTIKSEVFNIGPEGETALQPNTSLAKAKLKFIVNNLLEDFHSYYFQGSPFNQKDVMQKTKALLMNNDLMKKVFKGMGKEQRRNYVEEATKNLGVLENPNIWNEPNHELESVKIEGTTITVGQIYSLFLYYIDRQKTKDSYLSLVGGLVQALANSEAMTRCKEGAMSGIGNTTFQEEFKQTEKENRSYKNYYEIIYTKVKKLKTILIYLLSHPSGGSIFDIHNPILVKYFPDIENNPFLDETFKIINIMPLETIFGEKLYTISELFSKSGKLTPEELRTINDVNTLIINPVLLAFFAQDYRDFVIFTPNYRGTADKMSFPDYLKEMENIPYDANLIEKYFQNK